MEAPSTASVCSAPRLWTAADGTMSLELRTAAAEAVDRARLRRVACGGDTALAATTPAAPPPLPDNGPPEAMPVAPPPPGPVPPEKDTVDAPDPAGPRPRRLTLRGPRETLRFPPGFAPPPDRSDVCRRVTLTRPAAGVGDPAGGGARSAAAASQSRPPAVCTMAAPSMPTVATRGSSTPGESPDHMACMRAETSSWPGWPQGQAGTRAVGAGSGTLSKSSPFTVPRWQRPRWALASPPVHGGRATTPGRRLSMALARRRRALAALRRRRMAALDPGLLDGGAAPACAPPAPASTSGCCSASRPPPSRTRALLVSRRSGVPPVPSSSLLRTRTPSRRWRPPLPRCPAGPAPSAGPPLSPPPRARRPLLARPTALSPLSSSPSRLPRLRPAPASSSHWPLPPRLPATSWPVSEAPSFPGLPVPSPSSPSRPPRSPDP
mmetsp:Transcript_2401/g.9429  ORF Transcript_2401/g.9429 Transcript_2401/m.9429 type:complete len:436 (+) Transcript_2401:628-1935(+)